MAVMKRWDVGELNGGSEEEDASGCIRALTHSSACWRSERADWEALNGEKPADQTARRDADGQETAKHKQKDMNG